MNFPQSSKLYNKAAIVQGNWDLCSVLCALERHRHVHGELPERLEALVPEFLTELPHDYVTGLPPHYRIQADGHAELATLDWEKSGGSGDFSLSRSIGAESVAMKRYRQECRYLRSGQLRGESEVTER